MEESPQFSMDVGNTNRKKRLATEIIPFDECVD